MFLYIQYCGAERQTRHLRHYSIPNGADEAGVQRSPKDREEIEEVFGVIHSALAPRSPGSIASEILQTPEENPDLTGLYPRRLDATQQDIRLLSFTTPAKQDDLIQMGDVVCVFERSSVLRVRCAVMHVVIRSLKPLAIINKLQTSSYRTLLQYRWGQTEDRSWTPA